MSNFKTWISAMRLRTLPLAVSGIIMGSALSEIYGQRSDTMITILALITAVLLQILSNLANDYGDFKKGTDNDQRLGNMRALQSGKITPQAMLRAIMVFVGLCLTSGVALLFRASATPGMQFMLFLLLGIAAIIAAIKYTVGKKAYGYNGFGDVFVFIFFGPVSVLGVYMLHHHFHFNWVIDKWMLLPAIAIGFLSTAVLNTNNIRDIDNDRASGKNTIVVKSGLALARRYHILLIGGAFFSMLLFIYVCKLHPIQYLSMFGFVPIIRQAVSVYKTPPSPAFNLMLKQLSLGTLLFVVVFVVTQTIAMGIFVSEMNNTVNHYSF